MKKHNIKIAAFVGSVLGTAALTGAAIMGTGAYFQDTADGTVSAQVGSIQVTGTDLSLSFNGILPGNEVTDTGSFKNTGLSAQDVYLVANPTLLTQVKPFGAIKVNGAFLPANGKLKIADLNPGESANVDVTFAMKAELTETSGAQGVTLPSTAGFTIVATQDGQAPR